jgi:hypothetical protein
MLASTQRDMYLNTVHPSLAKQRREEEGEREERKKESSMMILTGEKNLEPKPHFPKFHMKSAQF